MDKIIFDDRTAETPAEKLEREAIEAGKLLVGFAIHVSQARPAVGLGALTYALGMGSARVGASLEEVIEAVRAHYEATKEVMAEENVEPQAEGLAH